MKPHFHRIDITPQAGGEPDLLVCGENLASVEVVGDFPSRGGPVKEDSVDPRPGKMEEMFTEGIPLDDAPMFSVSLRPLQDLSPTIRRESGKSVLSLELPEGNWPPPLGGPLRVDYTAEVFVHRDGQSAPDLEGVAKELSSTARRVASDHKTPAVSPPGGAYCQTVGIARTRFALGSWKSPEEPWRGRLFLKATPSETPPAPDCNAP